MKPSIDIGSVIHPRLHQFVLIAFNFQATKNWYAKVFGTTPNHEIAAPDGRLSH